MTDSSLEKLIIKIWIPVIIVLLCILNTFSNLGFLKTAGVVSTITYLGCLLFKKLLWKCIVFKKVFGIHNLNGIWTGYLKTTWIDNKTGKTAGKIPVFLVIKQDFLMISCQLYTKESESVVVNSQILRKKEHKEMELIYSYFNVPKPEFDNRSRKHYGTIFFDKIIDNNCLEGKYWTDRNTTGTIKLKNKYIYNKDNFDKAKNFLYKKVHPVSKE